MACFAFAYNYSITAGLQGGVPDMMEINPSQLLTEAFDESYDEESELEEDMVSPVPLCNLRGTYFRGC